MPFAKSATIFAALVLAALTSQPAMAQASMAPPVVSPEPWTVVASPDHPSVQIGKTALNGGAVFLGGCSSEFGPGLTGAFSRYGGRALQTVDGQSERVLFEVHGEEWKEAFAVQLRYVARSRSWEITKVLAPVFVNSFSRGDRLTVLNSQRQEVFSFDLTGSSAAARTMRSVCGFQ